MVERTIGTKTGKIDRESTRASEAIGMFSAARGEKTPR
jgi:hypothetical protein